VFNDLYEKGLIYRGKRMINWDPKAKTALSDEEVIYREVQSKLYYLTYKIDGSDETIIIATVRPETILGDTAICVHPDDERYAHLKGRYAIVPLIGRKIPIISDEYVDKEFGTGALKITPAHDMNDYQLGQKHKLEVIDVMNDDGTMSEAAQLYIGEDRFEVRKKIVEHLKTSGDLLKIEEYTNQVGFSERSDAVVEPRLSLQWWVKMKPLAEPALKVVMDDDIKFYPNKFRNTYRYWMENIKDWCISRQLWWGHRIPAWYAPDGTYVVANNVEEAFEKIKTQNSAYKIEELKQDEDCLDTWFSSWLWPFEVFKGMSHPGNAEVNYYYPTNTLVTAPEIIFFWVARMIMAGLEYEKEIPFKEVYFTGIVRDKLGRKMSKSLGNSPDLLGLLDQYGADAVRFGILISSPAGNDLLWDESSNEQGRNFTNKLWNALKLVKMWEGRQTTVNSQQSTENFAVNWFANRLNEVKAELETLFAQFRLSEALKTLYSLIWDDFCSWYLEWVKPGFEQPIDANVYAQTVAFFEELMQLLHPFMPFITEEIYHLLKERKDDITVKQLVPTTPASTEILQVGKMLQEGISAIRDARKKYELKNVEQVLLTIDATSFTSFNQHNALPIIEKQVNASIVDKLATTNEITIVTTHAKYYLDIQKEVDTTALKDELLKDLEYQKGFLQSVMKKLSNERFVQNAKPEVVEMEKKKQSDAEARIKTIEESLANLN
jgi:valyl-tRNA synthetase